MPSLRLLFGLYFVVAVLAVPGGVRGDEEYEDSAANNDVPMAAAEPQAEGPANAVLRRPVKLVLDPADANRLLVANEGTGSVTVVDRRRWEVAGEIAVGKSLSDLVVRPGTSQVCAVDRGEPSLVLLESDGEGLAIRQRVPVGYHPVSVAFSGDGRYASVACLWGRRLYVVDLQQPEETPRFVDLPFAPRAQQVLPGGPLLVADAFRGQLAIFPPDFAASEQLAEPMLRDFPAHNIRDLEVSPDGRQLLVTHQIINSLAETTQNDVHWGILMTNTLRWLNIAQLLDPEANILSGSRIQPTGTHSNAGGDPAGIAVTDNGYAVVAVSGADEVVVDSHDGFSLMRTGVGRRPLCVCLSEDQKLAYVAAQLDDEICEIEVQDSRLVRRLRIVERGKLDSVAVGERLFFDATLAMDGWFSCHSCHTDGHSNGMLNDNQSDESFGAAKRVLSLGNVAHTGPWSWRGKVQSLTEQIENSVTKTMQGNSLGRRKTQALANYLATIESPPPLAVARRTLDAELFSRGELVFQSRGCVNCHAPPTFTSPGTYDVGLVDKKGNRTFNPPSLKSVSQRESFFHDGRAGSLRAVLVDHQHQLEEPLGEEELRALVHFLEGI